MATVSCYHGDRALLSCRTETVTQDFCSFFMVETLPLYLWMSALCLHFFLLPSLILSSVFFLVWVKYLVSLTHINSCIFPCQAQCGEEWGWFLLRWQREEEWRSVTHHWQGQTTTEGETEMKTRQRTERSVKWQKRDVKSEGEDGEKQGGAETAEKEKSDRREERSIRREKG